MTIVLDGSSLTLEKLVRIAREGEKVELAPAALERVKICRAISLQTLQRSVPHLQDSETDWYMNTT